MPEPSIKQRLESSHFTGHPPAVQNRLNNCLTSDAHNIRPGSTPGPHIAIIQAALKKVREKITTIPEITDPAGTYGPSTAAAVLEYKRFNGIVRTGQALDSIVGRMTLTRLDEEMKNLGQGPPVDPVPVTGIVDVVVRFRGVGGSATVLNPNDVLPDRMLKEYNAKSGRTLLRIGQNTNTIRADSVPLLDKHVAQIDEAFKGKTRGAIFIYGSSSGGRNALDLAVRLTAKGFAIALVAPIDAAFFPNEALNKADAFKTRGGIPKFAPSGGITAGEKRNFFQIAGNHTKLSFQGLIFTSNMGGQEVHGDVAGFTPDDLTSSIERASPKNDDDAHVKLIIEATPKVQSRIKTLLDKL